MKYNLLFTFVAIFCLFVMPQAIAEEHNSVYGAWDLTVQARGGPSPSWVKLFTEGDRVAAEFVGAVGGKNRAEAVKVEGDSFEWTIGQATYRATLNNGKLTGQVVAGDRRTEFTGRRVIRKTSLNGTWDVKIDVGDRTMERILKLEQDGDQITGSIGGGSFPEHELADAALDDDRLTFSIEFANDDREFTAVYDVEVRGDWLAGTVSVRDTNWEGDVKGTRQRNWSQPIELIRDDLSNWDFQEVGEENRWKVADGVLVNEGRGWNIFTKDKFKDYKLHVEVKIPQRGNSGIYLNGRYEVQVADSYGRNVSEGGMGAIYGRAVPTANPSKPADEWQTFEITFVNYWATVVLNGTTIIDNVLIEGITGGALDSFESEPGPIMLQGDHGPIQYRNIVLTSLAK